MPQSVERDFIVEWKDGGSNTWGFQESIWHGVEKKKKLD